MTTQPNPADADEPGPHDSGPHDSGPHDSGPHDSGRDEPGPNESGPNESGPEPPSYEAAREELIELVRRLETGGTTLQESLALWERAEELAVHCQRWLEGARRRLDEVTRTDDE